jgi:misacylated tRNA(Ala) deacylase
MTRKAFLEDAYLTACEASVEAVQEDGTIVLDQTNFYANSGGQPGDSGYLELADGSRIPIVETRYGPDRNTILHVPGETATTTKLGDTVICHVDWERRYNLMRMHTACHILSVVCPYPITSANVGETESRVDFDLPEAGVNKEDVTREMMEIVLGNHPVFTQWITVAELDANPEIVKSKNVKPPRGAGDIRLVCIGNEARIDSQPCGGTHVSETQEVGDIHIGKIEKKGKENRRFRIRFGPLPA